MEKLSLHEKSERAKRISEIVNSVRIPFTKNELREIAKQNKVIHYTRLPGFVCKMEEVSIYDTVFTAYNRAVERYKITCPIYYKKFFAFFDFVAEHKAASIKKHAESGEKHAESGEKEFQETSRQSTERCHRERLTKLFSQGGFQPFVKIKEALHENADALNLLLSKRLLAYNPKAGMYYLPLESGKQLLGDDYTEPVYLNSRDKKKERKALEKMHDSRLESRMAISDSYRVEFNQEKQLFHYDDGSHEENTFGWRTVEYDVKNIDNWIVFDKIRQIFKYKFSDTANIKGKYADFQNTLQNTLRDILPSPGEAFTIEKCIAFLKENGYTGKIEKIIKENFEL
jgi:hypothetical protein